MERRHLSYSLKDHSIARRATNNISSSNLSNSNNDKSNSTSSKLKYPCSYSHTNYGDDYLGGFSWPPRSYTCSFCKREFRSAQALGGHMNVHRRDRARLRQSPPRDSHSHHLLNVNRNPNPNPSSLSAPFPCTTSPALSALCSTTHFHASCSTKTKFDFTRNFKTRKSFFETTDQEFEDGRKLVKKAEILRLELEIGLSNHAKEDLDLELRLGYC